MRKKTSYLIGFILIVMLANPVSALEQHEKAWLAVNAQQALTADQKWLSYFNSQLRLINESHPWQTIFLEGAIGYRLTPDNVFWLGYRWSGHNPNNGFSQEHRLFQQFNVKINPQSLYQVSSRSRLEEFTRTDENQIALRFRQRIALEIQRPLFFNDLLPYFYNEVFLQLNNTDFTPHKFFGENRLFLGGNFYLSKNTWWEIGYINQYSVRNPQQRSNQMNHILSVTSNFR